MAEAPVAYLAYGSNLFPRRLAERVGAPMAARPVQLANWSLRFHKRSQDGSGKCDIVPVRGHVTYGVIYTLTREAKRQLDSIEGVGFGYQITAVELPGEGRVTTYRAHVSVIDRGLRPYAWYHRLVVAGARHHGFPDHYLDQLTRMDTLEDPDRARHTTESRILKID
jgi:hypothetical protein